MLLLPFLVLEPVLIARRIPPLLPAAYLPSDCIGCGCESLGDVSCSTFAVAVENMRDPPGRECNLEQALMHPRLRRRQRPTQGDV